MLQCPMGCDANVMLDQWTIYAAALHTGNIGSTVYSKFAALDCTTYHLLILYAVCINIHWFRDCLFTFLIFYIL